MTKDIFDINLKKGDFEMEDFLSNPFIKVIEAKIMNNAVEAECFLCINDGINEFTGLSCCKIGKIPEIVWDEARNRAIFYCEKYENKLLTL